MDVGRAGGCSSIGEVDGNASGGDATAIGTCGSRHGIVKLAVPNYLTRQEDANPRKSLSLHFVDGHGEGWRDRELLPGHLEGKPPLLEGSTTQGTKACLPISVINLEDVGRGAEKNAP